MHLESVTVQGFQSYRDPVTVSFDQRLTLIAGRNNVGKSALLRALRLTRDPSSGCREDFRLVYRWLIPADLVAAAASVDLRPDVPQDLVLVATLERKEPPATPRAEVQPAALTCSAIEIPQLGIAAREGQWTEGPLASSQQTPQGLIALAMKLAGQIAYLAHRRISPGRRGTTAQPYLMPDGQNLTEVMINLLNNKPMLHRALMGFMSQAFPEIATITASSGVTDSDRGQSELTVFYEGAGDNPVPLTDCGTGIEQMLAVGMAIFTTDEPNVFLIDEPQLHLHPHAERSLLQLLEDHDQHQYVIATHSPSFLRAQPLTRTRLITMVSGRSQILETAEEPSALLEGLGLTGADLWLAERIIWVEGPSDVAIVEEVLAWTGSPTGNVVRGLPAHTRFSSAGHRIAQQTYDFCREIASAISPLPVEMLFLFDSDEKSDEVKAEIERASGGRARFLPCREIENLLLEPDCVAELIARRLTELGLDQHPSAEIDADLDSLLSQTDDRSLYPAGPPEPHDRRDFRVSGSEVLARLYLSLLKADYRKVQDGPALAALVIAKAPERLSPLVEALSQ